MPVYDYRCRKCGKTFSLMMSVREKETKKIKCPDCKSSSVRPQFGQFFAVTSKKS